MTIDIKDIEKISLAADEMLWVTVDSNSDAECQIIARQLYDLMPDNFKGRVIVGPQKVHLQKIVLENLDH